MNERASRITVAVVLAVALVAAAFLLRGTARLPETPEAAVNEFFNAAGQGDADAYLRLVSGELRKSLQYEQSQLGTQAFRENIKRSVTGIKGLAVRRNDQAPPGFVAVDVELIFADRNETQKMLLAPQGNGWAITSIEAAQMVKPPIPYGTPVFEEQDWEQTEGESQE